MELLIRVQKNKKLIQGLVKFDNLFVDTDIDNKWCIQQSGDTLGIYNTEKRALEVLDEIQNKIENTIHIPSDINDVSKQVYTPPFMIYEMPEE